MSETATGFSKCPSFDPADDDYERWRKKAEMWSKLTTLPKSKQGLAAACALKGKADKQGFNISMEVLEQDNGFQTLLEKLDEVFMPDKLDKMYNTFIDYYNCRRKPEQKMSDFLPEYHAHKLSFDNTGGNIDKVTEGLMLLGASKLTPEQPQIIRGRLDEKVSYDNAREVLKLILGTDIANNSDNSLGESSSTLYSDREKQSESTNTLNGEGSFWNRSGFQSRPYRGRARGNRPWQRWRPYTQIDKIRGDNFNDYKKNNLNYTNKSGRLMLCDFCGSKFHLRAQCPDMAKAKMLSENIKGDNNGPKFSYFTVFLNEQRENKLDALLNECSGLGVLDCGCPNTVCGDTWLDNYISTLGPKDLEEMETTTSSQAFTFGDGKTIQAFKRVKIPVHWGGEWGIITADVVKAKIPLLLSAKVMLNAEMVLDFKQATVRLKVDVGKTATIKLNKLNSGHYAIPLSL